MLVDLTGYLFFDSLQEEVYWFFLGQCYTWYGWGGGVGKWVTEENPRSDLDLDLGSIKNRKYNEHGLKGG